jgi:uncharacterized repeat protein (TIGR01451 family)
MKRSARIGALLVLALTASVISAPSVSLAGPKGGGSGGGGSSQTAATFVDYAQCANGAPPDTSLACPGGWINGILQASNSHYAEDEVTAQRLGVKVPKGTPATGRTVTLRYQTRKGTIHAYDSLATWNYTQTSADRCQGLSAANCPGGTASTFDIPDDPTPVPSAGPGISDVTAGHMVPAGPGRKMTMYGGTITGVSVPVHDNAAGPGDDYATITITYSVANTTQARVVQLLFGGHLASSTDPDRGWGAGFGSSNIAGGPYHIKFTLADGVSIGNRDNQIMGAAIAGAPALTVTKTPDASPVNAGDPIGFTINVENTGSATALNVTLTDPLPSGDGIDWSIDPANAACSIGGTPPNEDLSCSFGDLLAGGSASVHIVSGTTSDTSGTFPNTATAHSDNAPDASGSGQVVVNAPFLETTKSPDETNVNSGDAIGFTITVTNSGLGTAKDVTLTDDLPGSAAMGTDWSISPVNAACSISGAPPAETLTCSFGDLISGASASVHVTSPTSSSFTGQIENTAIAQASNHPPVPGTGTTNVDPPDLTVTKLADAASVSAGDTIGFTITVENNGTGTAKNVTLSRPLPSADGVDWSIDPANAACSIGGDPPAETLTCSFGDIAAGDSVSVHVTSATTSATAGDLPNTATAQADNHPPTEGSATITVLAPDLVVTKSADAATVGGGGSIGFTITIVNTGGGEAKNVTLSDELPGGTDVDWSISPATDGCSISGSPPAETLSCSFGDIEAGGQRAVHVVSSTSTSSCGTYPNTVTVSADNIGSNETSSATITVVCPDLALVKSADKTTVQPGGSITYTLTYSNTGDGDAESVVITEAVPPGTEFSSCTGDCTVNGTSVTWQIGTVTAGGGGAVTLTVTVLETASCSICNTATISSPSQSGADRSSNTVCVDVTFAPTPGDANASGSARGVYLNVPVIGEQTISSVQTARSGPGPSNADSDVFFPLAVPEDGTIVSANVVSVSSASTVTAEPSQSRNVGISEVVGLNVLNGLVTADVVRAYAEATASGDSSSVNSLGSTFKNLVVNGEEQSNVPYNHRIDLPEDVFGPGSYVMLYERIASTSGPAPGQLSGGTYTADLEVRMIRVEITDLLSDVLGDQSVRVIVSEAIAHADFPQTRVCDAAPQQAVSGHAFFLSESTDPAILPTVVVYAGILPSGGNAYGSLNDLDTSFVNANTVASSSQGTNGDTDSTASSYTEAEDLCVLPSADGCLVSATALHMQSNSTADADGRSSDTLGTEFLSVIVGGMDLGDNPDPNTTIELPGLGFVTINEQTPDAAAAGHTGLTIRAVHIVVTVPDNPFGLALGAEIIVGEAHSDATWL